jgi:uncharacterized protein YcbK (DUF882 family)
MSVRLTKLRYFKPSEFACKCGCGGGIAEMNPDFLERLDYLREDFGAPLVLTSAFRCSKHNQSVSTTGANGPHTTGRAVDILIARRDALSLIPLAYNSGFTGIGVQQKGAVRFIHLDDLPDGLSGPRPTVWSY